MRSETNKQFITSAVEIFEIMLCYYVNTLLEIGLIQILFDIDLIPNQGIGLYILVGINKHIKGFTSCSVSLSTSAIRS